MIKKLRRKFVLVVMGVATVILLGVFLVLLFSTKNSMERQSEMMLQNAVNAGDPLSLGKNNGQKGDNPLGQRKDGMHLGGNSRFTIFTAIITPEGEVQLPERATFLENELTEEEIISLSKEVAALQDRTGYLFQYRLRYAVKQIPEGTVIALTDTTVELSTMTRLIELSLVIGTITLLVLLGASILLARWAVRPVEEAWQKQKQFIGDASHELKTPLTVILSNADMMLSHPEEPNRRWAENIKIEAQRMKHLTQEMLSLAAMESAAPVLHMEQVDFSDLLYDTLLSFEAVAFEHGLTLEDSVEQNILMIGDKASLSRLSAILLDNAVKYASKNGIIRLALTPQGKQAKMCVESTGEPISPSALPHLFERFYREDPARHDGSSHGLGLAIAEAIVSAHKGKIWAESKDGFNRFIVTLPKL
jgi:two-component system sensor histidine kinase CiaH